MRKWIIAIGVAALWVPNPAWAILKVVNLSNESQRVIYTQVGDEVVKEIAPGESVYFYGSEGLLAIDVKQQQTKASHAKAGALSEILGDVAASNRTSGIPATRNDVFVIWPDGRLLFQYRTRPNGGAL